MNEKNEMKKSADPEAMSLDELDMFAGGVGPSALDSERPGALTMSRNLIDKLQQKNVENQK